VADSLRLQVVLDLVDRVGGRLRSITSGSRATGKSIAGLQERLRALDAQQQAIGQHRQLETRLTDTSRRLVEQRRALQRLQAAHQAVEAPSAKLTAQLRRQAEAVGRLSREEALHRAALDRSRDALARAGISTHRLAVEEQRLQRELSATNQQLARQRATIAALARTQKRAAGFKEAGMLMVGHGVGAWALKEQFAAPGKSMVLAFAEQETAAVQLRSAMLQANGEVSASYQQMLELAQELGNRLPGTTQDLLSMLTMLKRQGMSDQVILGGLGRAAAYLGAQLQMPYTAAAEFAAKLQDATRTSEADMLQLADTIQRAFYLGVDADNMLQGFTRLAPAMDVLRLQGIEATRAFAPLLVMFDQMGMRGDASGNALRKVFARVMDAGKVGAANKLLKGMGAGFQLDFTDGRGEFAGLEQLFAELEKLRQLSTQDRGAIIARIFGDDSETLTVLNGLMSKGLSGYQEVTQKLSAQADLQARVGASLGTLSALWEAASGTFQNALAAFGEAAAPQLKAVTEWLGALSEKLVAFARENPGLAGGIVKLSLGLGLLLAAAGAVLVPLGLMASAIGHLMSAWAGVSAALGASSVALGGIAAPLLAVAGIALLLWKFWEPIKAFLAGLWDGFLEGIQPVLPVLGMLWETLKRIFAPLQASQSTLDGFASAGKGLGTVLGWLATAIIVPLGLALQGLFTVFQRVGTFIGQLIGFLIGQFEAWWTVLRGIFTLDADLIMQGLAAMWRHVDQFLGGLPQRLVEMGRDLMLGLVRGITGMAGAVKDALAGIANGAIGRLKGLLGIHSPSRVFAQLGVYTMQGFAGGLDRGEAGPLAQIDRFGERLRKAGAGLAVAAAAAPAMALGAAALPALTLDTRPPLAPRPAAQPADGGVQIGAIHIHAAPGMDPQAIARAVRQEIERLERDRAARRRSGLYDYGD